MDDTIMDDTASSSSRKKRKRNSKGNSKFQSHRHRGDPNIYLSNTFSALIPNDRQETKRKELIDKLRNLIKSRYRYSEVFVYGSYASGTALYWSDLDIGMKIKTQSAENTSIEILNLLGANGFDDVKMQSRDLSVNKQIEEVYFVHCQDRESRIGVDCSLNNTLAAFSSSFIKAVVDYDISIRMFLVLIKEFAQCQGLNIVNKGTLPNIGHSYFGVFYLVRNNFCPQFLEEKDEAYGVKNLLKERKTYQTTSEKFPRPVTPLATLLEGYFSYYSKYHNFKSMAISLRGGRLVRKETLGWPVEGDGCFVGIVDPFNGQNVGSAVSAAGLKKIKEAFRTAHRYVEKGEFRNVFRPFEN